MDSLGKGWFSEVNSQWPTQALSLEYDAILWDKKSDYQHVQVFHNKVWGNVLVLDGVIQVTEKDEIAYHELIVHIPMFAHKNPERVLVVGGGDGGSIREALKHPSVKEVTICEIDQMVIDVSKQFLPNLAASYADPRVKILCRDAAKYMEEKDVIGTYDIIIADTSDPVGPAAALFEAPFYKCMFNALRPGGKVATQAESIWLNLDLIQRLVTANLGTFANVEYATTQIPTYPCGQIGFLLCSKAEEVKGKSRKRPTCKKPLRKPDEEFSKKLRFYTPEVHQAAFVLPKFVTEAIKEAEGKYAETAKSEQGASDESEKGSGSFNPLHLGILALGVATLFFFGKNKKLF
jgi:spermidine synthase